MCVRIRMCMCVRPEMNRTLNLTRPHPAKATPIYPRSRIYTRSRIHTRAHAHAHAHAPLHAPLHARPHLQPHTAQAGKWPGEVPLLCVCVCVCVCVFLSLLQHTHTRTHTHAHTHTHARTHAHTIKAGKWPGEVPEGIGSHRCVSVCDCDPGPLVRHRGEVGLRTSGAQRFASRAMSSRARHGSLIVPRVI